MMLLPWLAGGRATRRLLAGSREIFRRDIAFIREPAYWRQVVEKTQ
jgi:hypothetical protein